MNSLDKVIEYLHYHQGASRHELMDALHLGVKDTQMKVLLSEGVADGYIRVEGKARATRYFITPKAQLLRTIDLDSYYAVDADRRQMQTSYNFELKRCRASRGSPRTSTGSLRTGSAHFARV